jgi:hypothetical protein
MIHEDITELIQNSCAALTRDADGDRVFPSVVPARLNSKPVKRPLIRYQQTDDQPVYDLAERTSLRESTFVFEIQANTYTAAKEVQALLETAFDNCPKTVGGSYLKAAFVEDASVSFEGLSSGQEIVIHKNTVRVRVHYS